MQLKLITIGSDRVFRIVCRVDFVTTVQQTIVVVSLAECGCIIAPAS